MKWPTKKIGQAVLIFALSISVRSAGSAESSANTGNKMILVCFFDMQQRPSRNCILELSKEAQELKAKDAVVVVIQASKIGENELNEWLKTNNISFPVGLLEGDAEKTRFAWGVRSLPWLILTDRRHIVTAEGFGLDELDAQIGRSNESQSRRP